MSENIEVSNNQKSANQSLVDLLPIPDILYALGHNIRPYSFKDCYMLYEVAESLDDGEELPPVYGHHTFEDLNRPFYGQVTRLTLVAERIEEMFPHWADLLRRLVDKLDD